MSEYEPAYIGALAQYLCTFDYNVDGVENHADKLGTHITMCTIADEYNLSGLSTIVLDKFKATITETQTSADLARAYQLCYNGTTSGATASTIRQNLIALVVCKCKVFLPATPTEDSQKLGAILCDYPDLALDAVKGRSGITSKPYQCTEKDYLCRGCKNGFRAHLANDNATRYDCLFCNWYCSGAAWNSQYLNR